VQQQITVSIGAVIFDKRNEVFVAGVSSSFDTFSVGYPMAGAVAGQFGGVIGDGHAIYLRPVGLFVGHQTDPVLQETSRIYEQCPDWCHTGHRRVQVPVPHQTLELLLAG